MHKEYGVLRNNNPKEHSAKPAFETWSEFFKEHRKVRDVESVIDAWNKRPPQDCLDRHWQGAWGYRKNSREGAENAGEKRIERKLLGKAGTLKMLRLVREDSERSAEPEHPLLTAYHNFPLANKRKGQVISDVLGVVAAGGRMRPILIEVKVKGSAWYALVECLQQVKLARSSGQRICKHLGVRVDSVEKGAWGIVVAPNRGYFERNVEVLRDCKRLLIALKEKTEARVGFAFLDERDDSKLICIAGNWD